MSDRLTIELIQSQKVLAHHVALLARVERARLPQYLNLESLMERYAIDAAQVRGLLATHGVRTIAHGRGLRVHIDDVLRLDEQLRAAAGEVA